MKKKLLLTLVMALVFVMALAFAISAESVHEGKVDLNATVTLSGSYVDANGNAITTVNLFDKEGNALIWYKNGSTLESIRADDERVIYKCTYSFGVGNSTVGSVTAYEVSDMWIQLDASTKIDKGNIVVLNLMDDDVLINNNIDIGKPVNCLKTIAWANKVLEYAYCRLDTVALQQQAFCGCTMLKYVNLEDLTELRQIGGSQTFGQSSNLFKGETLDLTGTKLSHISGEGAFNGVPAAAIKLPKTVVALGNWCIQGTAITSIAFPTGVATIAGSQFNDCKSLTTIYINNTTTNISARAFNNTALEKVFFVGTLDELNALLDNTNFENNTPLSDVVGENRANLISYEAYQALEDKSGKYVVYNYNYCDAYNEGNHKIGEENQLSPCAGQCSECNQTVVVHTGTNVTVTIVYDNYEAEGKKITTCQNTGCTHTEETTVPAIFTFRGYSVSEEGGAGVSVKYSIDNDAIEEYETVTGNTLNIGLFLGIKDKVGTNEIVDTEGNTAQGVVAAQMPKDRFIFIEMKVLGLDDYKESLFAFGAYVIDGQEEKTVTYLQPGTPAEGDKYVFTSYNAIKTIVSSEEDAE